MMFHVLIISFIKLFIVRYLLITFNHRAKLHSRKKKKASNHPSLILEYNWTLKTIEKSYLPYLCKIVRQSVDNTKRTTADRITVLIGYQRGGGGDCNSTPLWQLQLFSNYNAGVLGERSTIRQESKVAIFQIFSRFSKQTGGRPPSREVFLFFTASSNKGAPKKYIRCRHEGTMKICRVRFIMQHICFFIIRHEEPEVRI